METRDKISGDNGEVTVDVTDVTTVVTKRIAVSRRLRFFVLHRDGFRCRYCGHGADTVELQVDHVIPVARGGTNDPENLVASCFDCNSGKRDKVISPIDKTAVDLALSRAKRLEPDARWRGVRLIEVKDALFYWSEGDGGITEFHVRRGRLRIDDASDRRLDRKFDYTHGCCCADWNYESACASVGVWLMTGFSARDALYEFYSALAQVKEFGWARIMVEESDCNPEIQHRLRRYRKGEDD
jgi:hypothetical protein